jgi:pyridoxamine 5'-phosphate oxidase
VSERVDYTGAGLSDEGLPDTPYELLLEWVAQARAAGVSGFEAPESLAMSFATVDAAGAPNVRTVLVRFLDASGPGFVTDTGSAKAREIAANPQVAGSVGWPSLFRVVRFRGYAERVDPTTLADYFRGRPWGSRVAALASHQSDPIGSREELDALFEKFAAAHPDRGGAQDVPIPDSWGGFRIRPIEVEFWAGRESRLHDRVVYVAGGTDPVPLLDEAGRWHRLRRQP